MSRCRDCIDVNGGSLRPGHFSTNGFAPSGKVMPSRNDTSSMPCATNQSFFSALVDAAMKRDSAARISSQLRAVRGEPPSNGYCVSTSYVARAIDTVSVGQYIVRSALCEFQPPRDFGCPQARVGSHVNDSSAGFAISGIP